MEQPQYIVLFICTFPYAPYKGIQKLPADSVFQVSDPLLHISSSDFWKHTWCLDIFMP